ncbi:MAG: succinate dehydrogenase, cytochrome b556 subunit [Ardenticatenaceae bacterium]|nr:MAG: succinate dehydrogenase, cytochrome b556 subunit [Ardenticatenaceae bacterium]
MYKTTGFISFLLRRISGLALALYLFMHIWVIGSVNAGPVAFDARMATVNTPIFKLLEVLLLSAVIYHGFDGIRILIVDYFHITEYRKSMFYAMFATFILVLIAAGVPIILFFLEEVGAAAH